MFFNSEFREKYINFMMTFANENYALFNNAANNLKFSNLIKISKTNAHIKSKLTVF